MDESLWPPLDEALVKKLEDLIPEKCPDIADDDRAIWMYVGQRQVVRMLRAVYLEQQDEASTHVR
jgi:hypothetical protein